MNDSFKINLCNQIDRRQFIKKAGAAAFALTILNAETVRGTSANSKIKLGIIGCGGRGTWLSDLFQNHGGYKIVACADYFEKQVNELGKKFGVDPSCRFTTLSGYKKLLESGVDAVAIESPPYFHPEHAAAAVDAGTHVYLAKPVAVDVPGCKTISDSAKKATDKNLCFLVDFQTRTNEFYIEAIKRVQQGAIGDIAFAQTSYYNGLVWEDRAEMLRQEPSSPEIRLWAWGLDVALSGDIITEQNIHTIDVTSWVMNEKPLLAFGVGGKKVRKHPGNCSDHFVLTFQYPNKVGVSFTSRQIEGHGSSDGIKNHFFGSKGVLETEYGGDVLIRGQNFYRGGKTTNIYEEGAIKNIASFYDNIVNKKFENATVEPSVTSTLVTILGRTASKENTIIEWDTMIKKNERLEPDLKGLKV
jgi:myo-inositol 2-dehydrogenase / D-chiro-inositol 1-dehydrogenase